MQMRIEDVAKKLEGCGTHKTCKICEFGFGIPTEECRRKMIVSMGKECRKIVEAEADDGK